MDNKNNESLHSFGRWFTIGALLCGTYVGANMASGIYTTTYMVAKGGGWALVALAIYCCFLSFFCSITLNFIHHYKIDNYNTYYLTLYGLNKPESNPVLKKVVSVYFDLFTMYIGIMMSSTAIALFGELANSIFGIPVTMASLAGMVLFAFLLVYGANFLRKFNTLMTISLLICLIIIFVCVVSIRGDILVSRIGNFQYGADWGGNSVASHFVILLIYCCGTSNWGATLCNYSQHVHSTKDAIGTGIVSGILITALFAITGAIVLPFLPEALVNAPILLICREYLPRAVTGIYWAILAFAVICSGPSFTYNIVNRYSKVWKTENIPARMKSFLMGLLFLIFSYFVSKLGLATIVKNGFMVTGTLAGLTAGVPLLISIRRVHLDKIRESKGEKE